MLRSLKIEGFKSIRSQHIELGRVTLLIGQNGAGKSNVLEAIGMLSAASDGTVSYESLNNRGVRLSTPDVYRSALKGQRPSYFNLNADFGELVYKARLHTDTAASAWAFHSESLYADKLKIAGRSARGVRIQNKSLDKSNLKNSDSIIPALELIGTLKESQSKLLDTLRNFAIYAPSTAVLRGVDSDSRIKSPLGLTGGGLVKAINEIILSQRTAEFTRFFQILPWYKQIQIQPANERLKSRFFGGGESVLAFADQFMQQDFNVLYSYDVSEGALYICFILTLMLHADSPDFFAVDNIDTGLNPGLVRNLIQHISELTRTQKKQVVLTTHNPASLDALDIFDDELVLYVVDRNQNGATVLNRVRPPVGMTRAQWDEQTGGAKLSELWMDGLLGGITTPTSF